MTESRFKNNLVDRLCRQAKEEFESTFHTLVFLSIYAKDNAVTYVTFYIITATNFHRRGLCVLKYYSISL